MIYAKAIVTAAILFFPVASVAGFIWFFILCITLKEFQTHLQPPFDVIFGIGSTLFALLTSIFAYFSLLKNSLAQVPYIPPQALNKITIISGSVILGTVVILLFLALRTIRFGW